MANLCIKTPKSATYVLIFQLLVLRPRPNVQSGSGEARGIQALKEEGFEDSGICASTLKQQSAKTIDCNRKPDSQACEC